ncbi:hypothetical protein AQUCO_09400017v1 [Aquilegia coerulea]|uniref:KIB1-4 beta-propeller domain-containing protein n=1 Tax=Aquilegia coerulea TaxID=218851 RepID=A0A2G5C514_AQUCA|nr:hypothetical protein AQUCO_09400017v1 [Aquilegia coerulea]
MAVHQNPCDNKASILEERKDLMVDWLELPEHLLPLIASKLINMIDYIRIGAVQWRSQDFRYGLLFLSRQLPVLMLPDDEDKQTYCFYNLTEKRPYRYRLSMPHNKVVFNSSRGWLVTLRELYDVSLLNPFMSSANEINLPSLKTLLTDDDDSMGYPRDLLKAALSSNQVWDSECTIMAIYGSFNRVAYCKLRDSSWTHIDLNYKGIDDVMYYKNQFYFVHQRGSLFSCDLNDPHPKVSKVATRPIFHWDNGYVWYYIVESNGNLLLVARAKKYPGDDDVYCNLTRHFFVFKLDLVELMWIEVKNLDGHTLFLGRNCSVSLSASDFPECEPNCIYYTNEHHTGYADHSEAFYGESHKHGDKPKPHDMGVFNLEDGSFLQSYYPEIHKLIPRPIWIEPTMQLF